MRITFIHHFSFSPAGNEHVNTVWFKQATFTVLLYRLPISNHISLLVNVQTVHLCMYIIKYVNRLVGWLVVWGLSANIKYERWQC